MTRSAIHLLIADDLRDAADPLAEVLSLSIDPPVSVDVAYDGQQAVTMAKKRPPAVAVLDIDMPVMNGLEAATAIRAALGRQSPVLVAVTGYTLHLAAMATHHAFDHVLTKPVDLVALLHIIDGVDRK